MANPPGNPNQNARTRTGQYRRTTEAVARDAEAARLYDQGATYREIAAHFGWTARSSAQEAVQRAIRDVAGPAKGARQRRESELQFLWEAAMEILNNDHVVVSNGRVIELNGTPLPDDGPRLTALDQLRKINESWRKFNGDDAPSRVSVEAEQLGRDIARLLDTALGPDEDDGDDTDA